MTGPVPGIHTEGTGEIFDPTPLETAAAGAVKTMPTRRSAGSRSTGAWTVTWKERRSPGGSGADAGSILTHRSADAIVLGRCLPSRDSSTAPVVSCWGTDEGLVSSKSTAYSESPGGTVASTGS